MKKIDFDKKISELRDKYVNSWESLKDIDQYEADISTLLDESKLKNHPVFIRIAEDAQTKLSEINTLLMNDEKLSDVERASLFKQKQVWLFIFERFKLVPHDNALEAMSQLLDSKLAQ